jgi:hypothetical protein
MPKILLLFIKPIKNADYYKVFVFLLLVYLGIQSEFFVPFNFLGQKITHDGFLITQTEVATGAPLKKQYKNIRSQ